MVSKLALLSNLLLASAALAAPSSRLGNRLARRREGRQSQPLKRVEESSDVVSNDVYSFNWAGAVLNGTFTSVAGIFTIPPFREMVLPLPGNGQISYDAWYEWYPDYAYDFSGINFSAGDTIQTTVTAYSTTSGVAVIENLTTGQTVQQQLSSSYALCEQNAEWIVEDFEQNGSLVPFANFGTVTFSSATALGPWGTYIPSDATIFDIEQNGQVFTSTFTSGESVIISYI